jgi:hypothetical protein
MDMPINKPWSTSVTRAENGGFAMDGNPTNASNTTTASRPEF